MLSQQLSELQARLKEADETASVDRKEKLALQRSLEEARLSGGSLGAVLLILLSDVRQ